MKKIKVCLVAKVLVKTEIELTDQEFEDIIYDEQIDKNDEHFGKYVEKQGFENPYYLDESFISMAGNPMYSYEILSRAVKPENIVGFEDPYLEHILYEEVE